MFLSRDVERKQPLKWFMRCTSQERLLALKMFLIILYFVGVHTHHATGFIGLDGMPPPRNSPNYFTVLLCSVYPPQILFFLFRPPWLKMPDVFGGPAAIERCVRILCC